MMRRFAILLLISSTQYIFSNGQTCTDFVESTTCGGNVIGDSGIIRYKHSNYSGNSGCLWLVRSNINLKIEVRLSKDTFSSKEFIDIQRLLLDGEIVGHTNWTIRSGDFATRQVDGPVILIKFSSLYYGPPTNVSSVVPGFTLLFRGCGPDIPNPPTFNHFYREKILDEREVITYPEEGLYPNNLLITYLGLRQDRAILNNGEGDWKVKVLFHDIEPSNYCLFADSLRFYSGGLFYLCAVDEQNEFIWRFCSRNNNETYILPTRSPKYGNIFPDSIGILAVFSADRSVQGRGFVFEW